MFFEQQDLDRLNHLLLGRAHAVVSMREIAAGNTRPDVVGLRHDIDDNHGSFDTATKLARWETLQGYRSTFYVLHTASYWTEEPFFRAELEQIALAGHEVGIHANAITAALLGAGDPHEILWQAIDQLRDWGHTITGVAPHGDSLCRVVGFVNDEQFLECARPEMGDPGRDLFHRDTRVTLEPLPLAQFGLVYEVYRLPKGGYLSDTGGRWNLDLDTVGADFATQGQLHILQHPDWWRHAFTPREVTA